jgi:hypothetical protein
MWIRKNVSEVRQTETYRHFNPTRPLIFSAIAAAILTFTRHSGWGGKLTFATPVTLSGLFTSSLFWSFAVLFVIGYLANILTSGRACATDGAALCPRCQKVQAHSFGRCCKCGGLLEPLRHWKWQDDLPDQ